MESPGRCGRGKYTLGLYSALRACKAMVLRSKRQSRLTVATMFLLGQICSANVSLPRTKHQERVYSLQGRHDTGAASRCARGRGRSSGSHPIAVDGISSNLLLILYGLSEGLSLNLFHRGWRGQIACTPGEGKRRGRGEGTRLSGVGRMGGE